MESNEENEYRNKLNALAKTLNEKRSILEARDRLMRLKSSKQTDLATAVAVVGTCPDMCPESERYFREETNQMSKYELDSNGAVDEHRMVKEYRRSGADQEEPLAHELRPTQVLNRTMDYLCINIMDAFDPNANCSDWYDFLWSRTRSIRKDLTQQHACDAQSVALTEKCARFHIHCSATLCEQDVKDFDPKINEENLSNCLQSLKDFYYDLSLRDVYCPNEDEFRCYEILLHLNDSSILRDLQNYRHSIRNSTRVQFAIKVFFAYQFNNYIEFFKLLGQSSYLMCCVLHRYFTPVRQRALKILRKACTSSATSVVEYSANTLISILGFDECNELKRFCDNIGLECSDEVVYLIRGQNQNNAIKANRSLRLVESKRNISVGEVVNGQPLPPNPYQTIPVHNSFDSEGRLRSEAIEAIDQRIRANEPNPTPSLSTAYVSKPTFTAPQSSKSLFPSAPAFFKSQTNTVFGPSSQPKPNAFSFTSNAFRLTQTPNTLNTNNMFLNVDRDSTLVSNQMFLNVKNETQNEFNNEVLDQIIGSISEELIESVSKELLYDICSEQLENIRTSVVMNQIITEIFCSLLLKTTDDMMEEIAISVLQEEYDLKVKQKKRMDGIATELSNELLNDCINSHISAISEVVLNESIDKQNELFANIIVNDLIDGMTQEIANLVHKEASDERESLFKLIEERRILGLKYKYWTQWRIWFLKRKRIQHLTKSFPAAPNWRSSTHSVPNILNMSYSRQSLDEYFEKTTEKELLAKSVLNNCIDLFIKEIAIEVMDNSLSGRVNQIEYIQQKRSNRLQKKYFHKWRANCVEKRRKELRRKLFPAAPDWRSTSDAISGRIKYSFSDLDSDIRIKRLRREESVDKNDGQKNGSNFDLNLKQQFETELLESKQFTETLKKSLEDSKVGDSIGPTFDTNVNEFNVNDSESEEDLEDMEVIEVFESGMDKIDRLKRLLSEEKDYFSLQNFVQYLAQNSVNCGQDSDELIN